MSCDDTVLQVELEGTTILTEVTIDHYHFKVSKHPLDDGCCIIWFRNRHRATDFESLGHFARYDQRSILFFLARYATSAELRREIDNRRFERQISGMTRRFFSDIERRSRIDKTTAFRSLFDLDAEIDPEALARRRRFMARRFHPDTGAAGDGEVMSLINQAYDHLIQACVTVRGN